MAARLELKILVVRKQAVDLCHIYRRYGWCGPKRRTLVRARPHLQPEFPRHPKVFTLTGEDLEGDRPVVAGCSYRSDRCAPIDRTSAKRKVKITLSPTVVRNVNVSEAV